MANVIKKATNRFTKGLVMDFSPENTKNEVLTHALNATLLTFNGNEMSLQNDMGNARVETAYLPEGYMPVGTCEYGGIIYIVSYNPLEDKSQIGCFPSPERNVSSDEIGIPKASISREDFLEVDNNGIPTGVLKHNTQYVLLKNDNLNPGDKFLICSNQSIYNEKLENLLVKKDVKHNSDVVKDENGYELEPHPILALNVVSIEESGKIVYLNSDIRRYDVDNDYKIAGIDYKDTYRYHILGTGGNINGEFNQQAIDIDSYRNALSSGYSVFKSKTSGKLAILAELIMIDSYSVTHSLQPSYDEYNQQVEGKFDVIIHTEVEPRLTKENFTTAPKLRYYYLENSQGYIQYYNSESSIIDNRVLFKKESNGWKNNLEFLNTSLRDIYNEVEGVNLNKTLGVYSTFNFPYPETYYGKMVSYIPTETTDGSIYTKLTEGKYHRFALTQIADNKDYFKTIAKFYKYNPNNTGYETVEESHDFNQGYTYYVLIPVSEYKDAKRDVQYKDPTTALYKLTTSALIATKTEIENVLIEKFLYEEVHVYIIASEEDKTSGKELWIYNEESLKFTSLTGSPLAGVTYYIRKVDRNLVSIGWDIKSDEITGAIYYYPTTKNYEQATDEDREKYFDFVTYPYDDTKASYGCPITLYYLEKSTVYKPATLEQIDERESSKIVLFYNTKYIHISDITTYQDEGLLLFMVAPIDTFLTEDQFVPNEEYNYIFGVGESRFEKDDPLYLYTLSNFIPDQSNNEDTYTPYHDIKLGSIQLPSLVYKNGIDLPFKYDYTIVPCMTYGRLDHLAVSNTVDFSKLHAFNKSGFTTWRYRIDDGYLRLTVGAEIFDTYETYKVDGLIFEFYDHRGFAGSLEFVDKKSYNGVFTKVIPLNSLQALSRKRILNRGQNTDYKHNINIVEEYKDGEYTKNYYLNNNKVSYRNYQEGWDIDEADNDCGTIYSNIVYGIKAYFRRTTDSGIEYIRKPDMFVYTLPIFNEYYYKLDNFMNISNPLLLFMLTYKLMDESIKVPYSSGLINQGYNASNKKQIDEYISGFYNVSQNITLDLIKYYKYTGTTNLYLEVGLKLDYNNINIAYNPELNRYFTCDLQLISDDNKDSTYSVVSESSGLTDPKAILNYNLNGLDLNINKMVFASTNNGELPIKTGRLLSSNFIHTLGNNPIKIDYEFIVGYTINVSNIRATNVPATTVCALCHKNSSGEYNYEDFGIYKQSVNSEEKYLSSQMVYNSGDKDNEIFGICRLVKTSGNMEEQCQIQTSIETVAKEIKVAGKLNSGEPLRQTVSNLGKLTFCLPHVHGLSEGFGVNVYDRDKMYSSNSLIGMGVAPNTKGGFVVDEAGVNDKDDCYGIVPSTHLYEKPLYNLALNTKNAVNYNSEFLSTFLYDEIQNKYFGWDYDENNEETFVKSPEVTMRKFTGFTGDEVATFNLKLIETMKSVYAYNPDYDSLQINVGDVTLQKYSPKFTSNIISKNSKFDFGEKNLLNDYIYISNINLTKYLIDLNEYSLDNLGDDVKVKKDKQFINHLQFTADYTYCGTDVAPYLINQLTYNTIVPIEIEEELTFNKSNLIVIKHHDNTNSFISGTLNKKLLYGYNSAYNKLITLDVSNYEIDADGKLSMKDIGTLVFLKLAYTIELDKLADFVNDKFNSHNDVSNVPLSWEDGVTEAILTQVNLNMNLILYNFSYKKSNDGKGLYILINPSDITGLGLKSHNFAIIPSITVTGEKYDYSVYIDSITMLVGGCEIQESILTKNNINLMNSNEDVLHSLIYKAENESLEFNTNTGKVKLKSDSVRYRKGGCSKVYIKLNNPNAMLLGDYKEYDATSVLNIDLSNTSFSIHLTNSLDEPLGTVGLYYVNIERINYTVTRISKLANDEKDIITNRQTEKYGKFTDNGYEVDSKFNSARIRGTSITLNDLYYEPNISGHRLFMKNDLCLFVNTHRGRIFYRSMDKDKDGELWSKTYEHLNTLYMMTGPCFTTGNL